jgi:hypothetical protein
MKCPLQTVFKRSTLSAVGNNEPVNYNVDHLICPVKFKITESILPNIRKGQPSSNPHNIYNRPFEAEARLKFKNSVCTAKKTQRVTITTTSLLKLFKDIIAVSYKTPKYNMH